MSLLTQKHENNTNDYSPTEGWHEVRAVGVADIGEFPNKFKNGKMQAKISVLFAFDEYMDFNGEQVQKTKVERFTASLHEKSGLVTKFLAPAGHEIESLDKIVGLNFRVKIKQEGEYMNISNCDEPEKPLGPSKDLYVPKFWLVDSEDKPTGFDIITEDGVIETLRDATAQPAAPAQSEEDLYK